MTLAEQRLIFAHKLGCRDYQEGKPMLAPTYITGEERCAYEAGYLGEQRRAAKRGI